jgi:glycine/D-amino acid oxidase-like deaminating enzyme
MQTSAQHSKSLPHLVIVGGGFSGLSAAKEVAGKPVRVTLIDRINHHLFQPLLYQVATAGLSPAPFVRENTESPRPYGTAAYCYRSQALCAWLRSFGPFGTMRFAD